MNRKTIGKTLLALGAAALVQAATAGGGDVAESAPSARAALGSLDVGTTYPLALDKEVIAGCTNCHKDSMSLEEWKAEPLAAAIDAMAQGTASHIVPMPQLSTEDREALAEALAGKDEED